MTTAIETSTAARCDTTVTTPDAFNASHVVGTIRDLGKAMARVESDAVNVIREEAKNAATFFYARDSFSVGFLMRKLGISEKVAVGHMVRLPDGAPARPEDVTAAKAAARKAWQRLLGAAGLVSKDARSGNANAAKPATAKPATAATRNVSTGKESAGIGPAIEAVGEAFKAIPETRVPRDGIAMCRTAAAGLLLAMNANPGAFPSDLRKAVEAFSTAVEKVDAKLRAAE
jgi:hypothetical protein